VILDQRSKGKIFAPDIAENLLAKVDDPDGFTDLLEAAGLGPNVETGGWKPYRFELLELSAYEVVEGFPRLTKANLIGGELPLGVTNVVYRVSLSLDPQIQGRRRCFGQVV